MVRELPKVMKHIEVPAQAGNNTVLENMRRGYTDEEYRSLISHIAKRYRGLDRDGYYCRVSRRNRSAI